MGQETNDFRPRIRISKVALLIIGGSIVAHAGIILASYLAPESPPEPSSRYMDCMDPAPATGEPAPTGTDLGGSGRGMGGGGKAHRVGSSFALGPEVAVGADVEIIWPCCGPGCPSELVLP